MVVLPSWIQYLSTKEAHEVRWLYARGWISHYKMSTGERPFQHEKHGGPYHWKDAVVVQKAVDALEGK